MVKNEKHQAAIEAAFQELYEAVCITLGPGGRLVIYSKGPEDSSITSDGVTVADKIVDYDNPVKGMILGFIKEICRKTVDEVGDGTSTSMLLAYKFYTAFNERVMKNNEVSADYQRLLLQVMGYFKEIAEEVEATAHKVEGKKDYTSIASISCNGEEGMGEIVGEAFEAAGEVGSVLYEKSFSKETELDIVNGMKFDIGAKVDWVLDAKKEFTGRNMLVFMIDEKIMSVNKIALTLMQIVLNEKKGGLVIMAREFDSTAMVGFYQLAQANKVPICLTNLPYYDKERIHSMQDLALATGGVYISQDSATSLQNIDQDDRREMELMKCLGEADKVFLNEDMLIIETPRDRVVRDLVESKIVDISAILEKEKSEFKQQILRSRISRLKGVVVNIRVGGTSDMDADRRLDRMEDAVKAVRSAMKLGYVPGGGVALRDACANVIGFEPSDDIAKSIVRYVCSSVMHQLVLNKLQNEDAADELLDLSLEEHDAGIGYDIKTMHKVGMVAEGIIDSADGVIKALENATNVVELILNTGVIIPPALRMN